jgi:hypothetical protein
VSEGVARSLLAAVVVGLVGAALAADLPKLSGGEFWGDGATYYSMAWSLAEDGDLRYEAADLARVRREFAAGPQGLFLKRASGGWVWGGGFPWLHRVPRDRPLLYFAKPFAYSMAAAPFVRLFGTRGLLLTNALALGVTLLAAYIELRRRANPLAALAAGVVLVLATAAPVYLLWPTPELFNMGLVAAGLLAWRRQRPLWAAVLLGIAVYSKPYNLWLALPLGLEPFLSIERPVLARLLESARRGVVLATATASLFALNAAITGELNYQGGAERKTFYGKFPGDVETVDGQAREVTFGNAGIWMTTTTLGPRVVGEEDAPPPSQGAEPARSQEDLRDSYRRNLAYFWIGRFGGALPYFFPAVLAALLFLLAGPREAAGWLALGALLVSYVFYLYMIPDNWYGGSGTVGNRYFLNLLPLAPLLVPRGREHILAVAGAVVSGAFLSPVWLAPMYHSLHPGAHATRAIFRALPAELSMLNDLAIFSETWRKKQPVGDTEGDTWRHWPADPRAYYLYFPDDGTYGREQGPGGTGFWLRGDAPAEVILRALEPVKRMRVRVTAGPGGDEVSVGVGGSSERVLLGPGQSRELQLEPGPAFQYKDTFVYALEWRSRTGAPEPGGERSVGSFVAIALEVNRRPASRR